MSYTLDAVIDPTRTYRYLLTRKWTEERSRICFIMLNPSTANGYKDDATIRSCVRLARYLGAGSLNVANLFAYRATDPRELKYARDPIGPENDHYIRHAVRDCNHVVCAWGVEKVNTRARAAAVRNMLSDLGIYTNCLGVSKDGYPLHPLYQPCSDLQPYNMRAKDRGLHMACRKGK